ncbi:mechanosensitive ion channel [candidate division KSB1 bacterium]|nr:mechanosensitive ion channel [candidate division KSB1 bacterium]
MIFDQKIYGDITVLDLLISIGVFIIVIIITNRISVYIRRAFKEKMTKDHLELIVKIVTYTIMIIVVLSILGNLGLNPSGLLVAGGVAGLVVGFASQSLFSNLISGLFLIVERPIKIGDQVEINDIRGFVEDIRIISTTLRTYDGLYVRIPNQLVFTTSVINFVSNIVRRVTYVVGIRYSDDADRAIEIIKYVADQEALALKNPVPRAFVDNFGDNSVNINVWIWAPASVYYELKMKLLLEIKKALEAEGIEIAFPQRVVWFGKELENEEEVR